MNWYEYMVRASEHAQGDGDLWFRYLYKVIQDTGTKLSTQDVDRLINNPNLTPFQKITLQDALTEGTFSSLEELAIKTRDYVHWWNYHRIHGSLNYQTPMAMRIMA